MLALLTSFKSVSHKQNSNTIVTTNNNELWSAEKRREETWGLRRNQKRQLSRKSNKKRTQNVHRLFWFHAPETLHFIVHEIHIWNVPDHNEINFE
jgi:hypothetical protein